MRNWNNVFSIGQRFGFENSRHADFILAQTGYRMVSLIALSDGNRLEEGIKVEDPYKITFEEMWKIAGGEYYELINNV